MQRVPLFDITSMHVYFLSLFLYIYDSIYPRVAPLDTLAGACSWICMVSGALDACMQCFAWPAGRAWTTIEYRSTRCVVLLCFTTMQMRPGLQNRVRHSTGSRRMHWGGGGGVRCMPGTGCVLCPFKTVAVNACPAAGNIQRLCRVECMQRHCCVGASFMHGPGRPPLCLCFLRLALGIGTTRAALPVYPVLLPATSALRLLHAPRLARSAMPACCAGAMDGSKLRRGAGREHA